MLSKVIMGLTLYNTLHRKKEIFKPIHKGEVRMYVCGPTVNDVPHLGHARQQVFFDVLRKYLEYSGYKVTFVSNITDIEDKIIKKAHELGEEIDTLTKRNTLAHREDYTALHVKVPDIQPKATEYIQEMVNLIALLATKGYAYVVEGDGVYYDVAKFKDYGNLSKQKMDAEQTLSRIKATDGKRSKEDFVVWKFSKAGEPAWDSPWGAGRPGWHIECSAMSATLLGLPFDIHGGGMDLMFPHHEDEIAQSEAAYDKKVANYWVHNGMVKVDNIKMSKSLGNFRTIRDLFARYAPEVIRYFVISTHYRKPIDFSAERLDAAQTAYERLKRKIIEIKIAKHGGEDATEKYLAAFIKALDDDLNTAKAIQLIWEVLEDELFDTQKKLALLYDFDRVLGFGIKEMEEKLVVAPKEVEHLVIEREKLRKDKKWAESDIIRARIREKGYEVKDTPQGPKIEKLS